MRSCLLILLFLAISSEAYALKPGDQLKVRTPVGGAIAVNHAGQKVGAVDLASGSLLSFVGEVPSRFFGSGKALKVKILSGPENGKEVLLSTIHNAGGTFENSGQATQIKPRVAPMQMATSTRSGGGHGGEASHQNVGVIAPEPGSLLRYKNYDETEAAFEKLQARFKSTLMAQGISFPLRSIDSATRGKIFAALKQYTWKEQAMLVMIGTSWAENRNEADDHSNPHDPRSKANKVYTMHTLKLRAEDTDNEYLIARRYRKFGSTARITGAIADEGMFSSWNSGSSNFKNMMNALVGDSHPAEKTSFKSAVFSYHDYVSGKTSIKGFAGPGGEEAHHMFNRKEVADQGRNVSWSIERTISSMEQDIARHKRAGTLENFKKTDKFRYASKVAVRVKDFSIAVPDASGRLQTMGPDKLGHWPAYLTMMPPGGLSMPNWKKARDAQGGW